MMEGRALWSRLAPTIPTGFQKLVDQYFPDLSLKKLLCPPWVIALYR